MGAPTLPARSRWTPRTAVARLPEALSSPRVRGIARSGASVWAPVLAVTALAAVLRLSAFSPVGANPYYDAAVRSMSVSWHNFLFGAFEPGGSLSIDKPPVDLWLQVASVKLLGFGSSQLRLPAALAGIAAVPLLYAVLRSTGGRLAAGIGALALAVLPIAVLTDRSDTMDSLMMALDVLAAWLALRAGRSGRVMPLLLAGAVMGVAFNVKLFEALIPLPAIVAMFWLSSAQPRLVRLGALTAAGAAFLALSLSWLAFVSLAPSSSRPFAIGSTSGSPWESTFVFNGLDRLNPTKHAPRNDLPGAARLIRAQGRHYRSLVGTELVPAVALGVLGALGAALSTRRRDGDEVAAFRAHRAVAVSLAIWLLTGVVVLSTMRQLHPRYVEVIAPALAGVLGLGLATLARGAWRLAPRGRVVARAAVVVAVGAVVLALLWGPFKASTQLVRDGRSDSGRPGALSTRRIDRLSRYLAPRTRRNRFEVVAGAAILAGPLITHDARPVLVLTTIRGHRIVSARTLQSAVRRGEVRYALLTRGRCKRPSRRVACSGAQRWARRNGTKISARRTGLPPKLVLLRLRQGTRSGGR